MYVRVFSIAAAMFDVRRLRFSMQRCKKCLPVDRTHVWLIVKSSATRFINRDKSMSVRSECRLNIGRILLKSPTIAAPLAGPP
jgi:hypothetical protein